MKRTLRVTTLLLVLLVIGNGFATAQSNVPRTISFQGLITNDEGVAIADGTHTMVFTIYDAATGGNALFSETQTPAEAARAPSGDT